MLNLNVSSSFCLCGFDHYSKSFFCYLQYEKPVSKNTMNNHDNFCGRKVAILQIHVMYILLKRSNYLDCFCNDSFCKIYHHDKELGKFP